MFAEIFRRVRFEDDAKAAAFVAHSHERKFNARRVFLFAGAITYATYAYLDHIVAGEYAATFVFLRLFIVTPIMLAVAILFATGRCRGRENLAFAVFEMPVMASIVYMCLVLDGSIADLYPIGMLIPALFMSMLMLPSFRFTMLLVGQVFVGLLVVTLFSKMSVEGIYTIHYFLCMGGVVLLAGMFFLESTERRQYIFKSDLEKTVETLRDSEQRAMDLYHEAKQAERAKSEFLAVVSHELRTPMNAIIGFSDIISTEMMGKVEPPQYREYATHINDSGLQLLNIINDILDISRADIDKITFDSKVFDIDAMIDSAILSCSANAEQAGILVERTGARADAVMVRGDQSRLMQAMVNIIGNAIKFSETGETVSVFLAFAPDGALSIGVADRGIGISQEDIEQIKKPFQQAEEAFVRNNGGLGLGLAICNIVATAHEGELQIESELEKGTTVSLILPPHAVVAEEVSQTAA